MKPEELKIIAALTATMVKQVMESRPHRNVEDFAPELFAGLLDAHLSAGKVVAPVRPAFAVSPPKQVADR